MSTDDSSSTHRIILWLRILVIVSASMSIIETVLAFFSDEPIALLINDELWSKDISDFGILDRLVLFDIFTVATVLWLIVLYQFWKLCRLYSANMIFTVHNARCFVTIGWAMVVMAIFETFALPLIGAYLKYRDIIPQMPDMDLAFMFELDLMAAGLFFWFVAKIMERAATMREEADLTV